MPFRDVIGHRRLLGLLARSIAGQSLPPSLIFAGPAGVGKRLTATALAQALNCLDVQPFDPESRTSDRRGASSHQPPATSHQPPATSHQPPVRD